MTENPFNKALDEREAALKDTEQTKEAHKKAVIDKGGHLIYFLNTVKGLDWLKTTVAKRGKNGDELEWLGKKQINSLVLLPHYDISDYIGKLEDPDLRLIVEQKQGSVPEVFFARMVHVCSSGIPSKERLSEADLSNHDYQKEAQVSVLNWALENIPEVKNDPNKYTKYGFIIFRIQPTPEDPFVCMVIKECTPKQIVDRMEQVDNLGGVDKVANFFNGFEEAIRYS
ncbi:hypothetical protein A2Z22_03845 [Candidatus Woesebacteria bacterium RBG_16_34_12]|uniref:Uncharacterized protein n=1 Tax=Candidatus Woesebacteria bacterium RBG_16_34_12 TaxID=1802480 RepID=A0A1F7X7T4_9BACT|nr:MAG: hypothetical protein A2Z22_03845 [Candidatus Woesebacteria bacterium RBG_16_34_12]